MMLNRNLTYRNTKKESRFHQNIRFIISVIAIVGFSCSLNQNDCACTAEYRGYSVFIVNSEHLPIDSLVITVTDENSQFIYRADSASLKPYHTPGWYTVLTDGELKYFTSEPKTVIFHATNQRYSITETFTFSAGDDCRCHILKVSGPDSITVQ